MAKSLEGMYKKSLDADVERKGAKEIYWDADIEEAVKEAELFELEEKRRKDAQLFELEEKRRKDAQRFTQEMNLINKMSREELESERNRRSGIEQNERIMYEIDKRIKQAERLEQDKLKESEKDRSVEYTGSLAAFMANSEEGPKTVDASGYITEHESNPYTALSFTSPEVRQQLEAELLSKSREYKEKKTEIDRIDKATHGLQKLAQGHEIEIDKGGKEF